MANLYIIDQSLKGTGGHHLDYARCVALAAQRQGLKTTIGTHRKFAAELWSEHPAVSANEDATKIFPVFTNTVYQTDSHLAGLQQMTRSRSHNPAQQKSSRNLLNRIRFAAGGLLHQRRRQWIARTFADGCARMFKNTTFKNGDHVFLAAVSELELMGLPMFFANNPATRRATWHLQFHFNLFEGRTDEYSDQRDTASIVAENMQSAIKRLNGHAVHFHTTSQTLADQYNTLGVAQFESLPYPIADEFRSNDPSPPIVQSAFVSSIASTTSGSQTHSAETNIPFPNRNLAAEIPSQPTTPASLQKPLRVVCPGGIRREKGQQEYLQTFVDDIWEPYLANEQLQLVVQRPKPKWPSTIEKISLQVPESPKNTTPSIQYAQHPLPAAEYAELIRSADIGLLFYDGRKYFSRRAGILGELLACGKPVIVPAGSWLSDQIEEANFAYADRVTKRLPSARELSVDELDWNRRNVPLPGGVVSFDHGKHSFEFEVFPEERERVMSLAFAWHWPQLSGVYCRIDVQQFSNSGQQLESELRVVGVRRRNQRSNVLFNVAPNATRVCFTLKNAFGNSTATIHQLSVTTFATESSDPIPTGVVGLAAADQNDLAACIREMVKHYDHYNKSAAEFSIGWNANHDPALTVDYLVANDHSFQRAA